MTSSPYSTRIARHRQNEETITVHRKESLAVGGRVIETDDDGFVLLEADGSEIFVAYDSVSGIRIKAADKKA